jgi:hypothetical protein
LIAFLWRRYADARGAETIPVLKVPMMMRLIRRTLAAENAKTLFFIPS